MDVREAVGQAREFVKELYAHEPIGEIGVEEVEFAPMPSLGLGSLPLGSSACGIAQRPARVPNGSIGPSGSSTLAAK